MNHPNGKWTYDSTIITWILPSRTIEINTCCAGQVIGIHPYTWNLPLQTPRPATRRAPEKKETIHQDLVHYCSCSVDSWWSKRYARIPQPAAPKNQALCSQGQDPIRRSYRFQRGLEPWRTMAYLRNEDDPSNNGDAEENLEELDRRGRHAHRHVRQIRVRPPVSGWTRKPTWNDFGDSSNGAGILKNCFVWVGNGWNFCASLRTKLLRERPDTGRKRIVLVESVFYEHGPVLLQYY
jgi:hypothetical protein